ncbi:ABC transporter permease [Methylocapsa sp. S129]|uniref:ABC transporter permease n=1 Tax=Methylocapsa sp. S129 TaxID=1641869 RepID=UPI00131E9749|nr:ABC transporter permease [Methylocapsa sp. S129]
MQLESATYGDDIDQNAHPHMKARGPFSIGADDLSAGLKAWRLWTMLGWNDILQRYRRSVLGPFWITLSMALYVMLLGVVYSRIFKMEIALYLPYIAVGLITWGFISGTTIESCSAFVDSSGIIKQIRLPFTVYVFRVLWRSLIIFLHTIVLIIPIGIIFGLKFSWADILIFPGLILLFANQMWVGIVVAVLSARYRDVVQLIATAIQIAMFATPIMWPASSLGTAQIIAQVNPLYHLIEIVRSPLLGEAPPLLSWLVVIGLCAVGYLIAILLLSRGNRRIVYWL